MPRLLDLNNARDSWLPVNTLTADLEFNEEAAGQVNWRRQSSRDPRAYSVLKDNKRARFPAQKKPECSSFYEVANANRRTTRRGHRFEHQPRNQCVGGKWWLLLGANFRTARHPPAALTPDFPDTPTMNRMVDKEHDTDTGTKMCLATRCAADDLPVKYHNMRSIIPRFSSGGAANAAGATALEASPAFHRMAPDTAALDAVRPRTAPAASQFSSTPTGRGLDGFADRLSTEEEARERRGGAGAGGGGGGAAAAAGEEGGGSGGMAAGGSSSAMRPQTASELRLGRERERGCTPGPGHYVGSEDIALGLQARPPAFTFSTAQRGDAADRAFAARVGGGGGCAESAQMLPHHQFAQADRERANVGKLGCYVEQRLPPRQAMVGRTMADLSGSDPFTVKPWAEVAERCAHDLGITPSLASRLPDKLHSTYASVFLSEAARVVPLLAASTNDANPEIGPGYVARPHDRPASVRVREPGRMTASFKADRAGRVPIRTDVRLMDGSCDTLAPRFSGQLPSEARFAFRRNSQSDPRERISAGMTFRPKHTKWTRVENGIVKGPRREYKKPWNERPSKAAGGHHIPSFD